MVCSISIKHIYLRSITNNTLIKVMVFFLVAAKCNIMIIIHRLTEQNLNAEEIRAGFYLILHPALPVSNILHGIEGEMHFLVLLCLLLRVIIVYEVAKRSVQKERKRDSLMLCWFFIQFRALSPHLFIFLFFFLPFVYYMIKGCKTKITHAHKALWII